jgi:hypothetical protein
MKQWHHGPVFAALMAHSTGDLDPLIARLDDLDEDLKPIERKFLADLLRRRPKGWPKGTEKGSLQTMRKRLCVAAYYLAYARGEPKGQTEKAFADARDKCGFVNRKGDPLDLRVVRRYVKEARTVMYQQYRWWDIALQKARKGQLEKLHQTY